MSGTDNPAARLHLLLSGFRAQADVAVTVHLTWSNVLEVDEQRVPEALAEVASLIPAIDRELRAAGNEHLLGTFTYFCRSWAAPIVAADHHPRTTQSPGPGLVDPGALAALGSVAAFLGTRGASPASPTADLLTEVRAHIDAAREDVTLSSELSSEVRALMLDRLYDILWALDHLRVGGPEAVHAAAERLVGTVMTQASHKEQRSPVIATVLKAAGLAWVAFKLGSDVSHDLEGWGKIIELLPGQGS